MPIAHPGRARLPVARARLCRPAARLALAVLVPILAGCVITPEGTDEEKQRLSAAGAPYEPRAEDRVLPDFPAEPTWRDVLQRGFMANGELEAAYFRWKAAIERIDIAGAYPNSDINLGFSYAFSAERMNSFDRTTFTVGFDAMKNLSFPGKTTQAAKVALDEARVAGAAFRVAKFDLQRRALFAWSDYSLLAQTIALKREDLALRRMLAQNAATRAATGERRRDLLMADLDITTAESELRDMEAEHDSTRATLNALLARDPRAALAAPLHPPPPRPVPGDDAAMLQAAAEMFPEVATFAEEITVRKDALELARLRWVPDINPAFMFTGSIMQAIGAAVVLPTTVAEIRGSIRQAQAQLRESEAMFRQRRTDRVGEYVSLLLMLRNAERKEKTFRLSILPAVQQISDDQTRAYEAGAATFADVIESRRALLDARLTIAQARAQIERATVEIECCLGVDIETIPQAPHTAETAGAIPAPPVPTSETHRHD